MTPALWNTYIRDNFIQVYSLASYKPYNDTTWISGATGGYVEFAFVEAFVDWVENPVNDPGTPGTGWADYLPFQINLPLSGLYSVSFAFTAEAATTGCEAFAFSVVHTRPATWSPAFEPIANIVTAEPHPRSYSISTFDLGFGDKIRLAGSGMFRAEAEDCVVLRVETKQINSVYWTFGTDSAPAAGVFCTVTYVGNV